MRRIALVAAMFAAGWSQGCATGIPLAGPGRRPTAADDAPAPGRRFARDAVPDAVMLHDQLDSGYRDSPIVP
jgi:hypothetical protein